MKKKILFVLLLFCTLLTISCKKDVLNLNQNVQNKITGYFDFKDHLNNDGSIGITSYKAAFGEDVNGVYQINGALKDIDGNSLKLSKLIVDNVTIEPTVNGRFNTPVSLMEQIKSFYGKEIILKSYKENNDLSIRSGDIVLDASLKMSKDIQVSSPTIKDNGKFIKRSQLVTWNADFNNTRKVIIAILFDPTHGLNKNFNSNKPNATYLEVDDTGQYQLTPNNFKNIPNGALISIFVARGNYTKVTGANGKSQYTIYGYSIAEQKFYIE